MNGPSHRKAVIGNPNGSFWLYDSNSGFDLTHPPSPIDSVETVVKFDTETDPVTIDPAKSALVIVDMQNFFLSPALGRPPDSKGLQAQTRLLDHAIPAARKAGIRVIWLNWGLTQKEINNMPPATLKAFGFKTVEASEFESHLQNPGNVTMEIASKNPSLYRGLGSELGPVKLEDGTSVEAGRMLMRDQWNSDLTPELSRMYKEGLHADPPDIWIHKNRMSGLWGTSTACTEFLDKEGIKTLLFTGVNTDQCVGGSLQDGFSKGYDCILLKDGAATSSPEYSQQCVEFNSTKTWGFCTDCQRFWEGVNKSLVRRR